MRKNILMLTLVLGISAFPGLAAYAENGNWHYQMGEIINSYLKIRVQLALDSLEGVEAESSKIARLTGEIQEALNNNLSDPDVQKLQANVSLSAIKTYAEILLSNPQIYVVRKRFMLIGTPLVKYVRLFGKPENVQQKVYVYYCPMFPGYWLQENKDTDNPYYGKKMRSCGRLIENNAPLAEDEKKNKGKLGVSSMKM